MPSFQRIAELQALLEGVALPATRAELRHYARRQNGGGSFSPELERLPDREYRSIDEVGETLARVQPESTGEQAGAPRAESGMPPGGDAYTDAGAEAGAVRKQGPGR